MLLGFDNRTILATQYNRFILIFLCSTTLPPLRSLLGANQGDYFRSRFIRDIDQISPGVIGNANDGQYEGDP